MLWLRRIAEVDQGCSLGLGSELWSLEKRDLVRGGVQLLVSWSDGVCVAEREVVSVVQYGTAQITVR